VFTNQFNVRVQKIAKDMISNIILLTVNHSNCFESVVCTLLQEYIVIRVHCCKRTLERNIQCEMRVRFDDDTFRS
jgi:hypothetical protein